MPSINVLRFMEIEDVKKHFLNSHMHDSSLNTIQQRVPKLVPYLETCPYSDIL